VSYGDLFTFRLVLESLEICCTGQQQPSEQQAESLTVTPQKRSIAFAVSSWAYCWFVYVRQQSSDSRHFRLLASIGRVPLGSHEKVWCRHQRESRNACEIFAKANGASYCYD
jgi:hypothetical protein